MYLLKKFEVRLAITVDDMPKHARKRQKISQSKGSHGSHAEQPIPNKAARLEMLLDEESKDDEERRLESLLFGVKYVPRGGDKGKLKDITMSDDDEDEGFSDDQGGRGLQHLLDEDVRFLTFVFPTTTLNSRALDIFYR